MFAQHLCATTDGITVDATDAFEKALELDPNNAQAKAGFDAVKRAIEAEAAADGQDGGLGNMFNDPQMIQKLANNPKTSHLLGDAAFMQKLNEMKSNPNKMGEAMQDPRFLQVMSVLLGIDMSFADPSQQQQQQSGAQQREAEEDIPMPDAKPAQPEPAKAPEPEPEPEDEEAAAKKKAKEEADKEKALGTENYKKRQFDAAIEHYSKAWDLYQDITYLTNLGAAKFEKGDYQGAIEACTKAVEHGREVFADFKLIAKAFGRIGTSYEKMGDLSNAVENYHRSLTEHRTPDILAKLRAAEKAKIKAEKESYIDPAKAEEARELGNQKFKEADWPASVEAYTEMIKRAPEDPRGYSNRAASLIKLLTFPSAVDDCNTAIAKDPAFIRAYLRKAQALFAMREYNKCIDVCSEATAHDKEGKNGREIEQQMQKALQAQYSAREGETEEQTMERIQRDPDILAILQGKLILDLQGDVEVLTCDRPHYAVDSATSQGRPGCFARAHEERRCARKGAEAHGCWCHSRRPIDCSCFFVIQPGASPVFKKFHSNAYSTTLRFMTRTSSSSSALLVLLL